MNESPYTLIPEIGCYREFRLKSQPYCVLHFQQNGYAHRVLWSGRIPAHWKNTGVHTRTKSEILADLRRILHYKPCKIATQISCDFPRTN